MRWNELSKSSLDEILAWAENQPWCREMETCQQDSGWHSEGDVWTHTQMVCQQLPQLSDWESLSDHEKVVLIFTGLFHDSGKPQTSQVSPETGRIQSPKHAIKGEHLARSALREIECPLLVREQICRLVRFHGRPPFLLEKSNPIHEVVSLSWSVSNKLLYLFALADTRGRKTKEMTRPEDNLHFWKMVAEENECFECRYRFSNDQSRFLFFRESEPNLHYVPHEDYRCTVTMLSGLPGSGKDTWANKNRPANPIVSLDDIRSELEVEPTGDQGEVAQLARERCREFLRSKISFTFNATNLLCLTRRRWIDLFADYGARIDIVYLEPPFPDIFERNRRRSKSVPEHVIRQLAKKLEPPTWSECHNLIVTDTQQS